ncbi:hypothetical protein HY379_00250 [Candidatus Saccharibacteria bacterium]|nr:hypothetical protein [Candidatus Saccharibacteria bacterium]
MSETYKYAPLKRKTREHGRRPKVVAAALALTALTAVGIKSIERNSEPQAPILNGPHIEYVVRDGDTVSGILAQAYPNRDWRAITEVVEGQLPLQDRRNHTLHPGQVLTFGTDAEIGNLVDNSAESGSVGSS